jgi:hypothetical protein
MKFLALLAGLSIVGIKLTTAVTCENESDPDSGFNGNWYSSHSPFSLLFQIANLLHQVRM